MPDAVFNRGDRFPPFKATLKKRNETTGAWEVIDLTEAESVRLVMVSGTTEIQGACTIVSPPTSGVVEYPWAAEDVEATGSYRAQVEILWKNGLTQTVPSKGYATIEIQADLIPDP
jgi:hypothetical protein